MNLSSPLIRACGAALIVCLTFWVVWPSLQAPPLSPSFVPPSARTGGEAPRQRSALINVATQAPRVHAPSVLALPDGRLFAVWFGGTREGASDVKIYAAFHTPNAQRTGWNTGWNTGWDTGWDTGWNTPQIIASPEQTGHDTGTLTRKLGNPVAFITPRGELWVIYVSVTLGGWAASHLNLLRSPDLGKSWLPARRLVVSPFFNLSTLVKGVPVFFEDGDVGVPVYHEMIGKFAELLVLTPSGEVRRKIRISHGRRSLQPLILVRDEKHAVALMRTGIGKRAWQSQTEDGGLHWSEIQETDLANPNSALAARRLDDGRLLAVANDTEKNRLRLSLLVSADEGLHWRVLHRFEDKQALSGATTTSQAVRATLAREMETLGHLPDTPEVIMDRVEHNLCRSGETSCLWQYDYPYLIREGDDFHLVYTWNRSFIRYISFNAAWLRAREKGQ